MKYLSLFALLIGIIYIFMIRVGINIDSPHILLNSPIHQTAKFHLKIDNNSLICNQKKIVLASKPKDFYWFHGEREVFIELAKGDNHCTIEPDTSIIDIKQTIDYIDYVILFILLVLPIIFLLLPLFLQLIDNIYFWKKESQSLEYFSEQDERSFFSMGKLLTFILLTGFLIRIAYFYRFGVLGFQHDWQGHIDFIQFMSQNWRLPIPTQSLEYPQQPLYYLITGGLYSFFVSMGLDNKDIIYNIGYFSLFCSFVFLIYSYRFIALLTPNKWVQAVAMAFLAFTPSIVYLSARINNDALVLMLSAISLYYIVKSYQNQFERGFTLALLSTSLLFLTKVSAASIELLLFTLLLIVYYHSQKDITRHLIKQKLFIFSVVGLLLLGFTLLRVYLPLENSFNLVNSSGIFPGQIIKIPYSEYFTSFNIKELIITAQSYVFGHDNIRYSFITYQYGTLFFGEFDYIDYVINTPYISYIMQATYSLGLIYIIGFIGFCIYLYRQSVLKQMLFVVVVINFILILKFLMTYPSVCNTDFRYFVSSFPIIAFILAQGLEKLFYHQSIKILISIILALLMLSELLFFYFLIMG